MKSPTLRLLLAVGAVAVAHTATPDYAVLQRYPLGGTGG